MLSFYQRLEEINFDFEKIPNDYICPINIELMEDPVVLADGFSYERSAANALLAHSRNPNSPKTRQPLANKSITPNNALKIIIRDFVEKQIQIAKNDPYYQKWQEALQKANALEEQCASKKQKINTLKHKMNEEINILEASRARKKQKINALEQKVTALEAQTKPTLLGWLGWGKNPVAEISDDSSLKSKKRKR